MRRAGGALCQTIAPTSAPSDVLSPTEPPATAASGGDEFVLRMTTTFHVLDMSALDDSVQYDGFSAQYISVTALLAATPPDAVIITSINAGTTLHELPRACGRRARTKLQRYPTERTRSQSSSHKATRECRHSSVASVAIRTTCYALPWA